MGLFNRTISPKPPYDTLVAEQRYALYFLLESFTKYMDINRASIAFEYLGKAAKKLGMTDKQIKEIRPDFNTFEKISPYIQRISNRQILEYMISNCSSMFNLMEISEARTEFGNKVYDLYYNLGYTQDDINSIRWRHQYDDYL